MLRSLLAAAIAAATLSLAGAAQAATVFVASLSGSAEDPPNASPGTGWAKVTLVDPDTLFLEVSFSGLLSDTTIAHIHGPTAAPHTGTAGVMTQLPTFVGFPAGVTAGGYSNTFDLLSTGSYNPAFVTANGGTAAGARDALVAALNGGQAYLNIHTQQFPAGEIRGFFTAVPEPQAWMLMIAGFGLAGLALRGRPRPVPA
ncbi:MAG: CHRD domain-containing protein [Phenylobacterium sp.]|uniref:CHRD domain-containing protein n=1 Tax=Phenylobacterium sp. TaxID=1871053 RepID=UPI00391B80EA